MAFSYGFYNSLGGDRKYDAEDISRMFDGLITDGVIGAIGDTFAVKASSGTSVTVGSGRAWFDHTWSLNDAAMPVDCGRAGVLMNRYDAIVLEVNASQDKRENSIKIIAGTEASSPEKPTLEKSEHVHQYPLAYILRVAGSTTIEQAQIENTVGTSECPLCTGILETMDAEQILAQWDAQFTVWFNDTKSTLSDDVAGNLLTKIRAVANVYAATLPLDGWGDASTEEKAQGYNYKQTVAIASDNALAPPVTADSTFLTGVFYYPTQVKATDEVLDEVLNLINKGVTTSGDGTVTVLVEEKPEADFIARWTIQA